METLHKKRRQLSTERMLIADQFQGVRGRAGPGQPPRERRGKAYNLPFAELDTNQRAAAREVLGIVEERAWELAMPRRIKGFNESSVILLQTKIWSQLSLAHQKLAREHLDMDESFWNEALALFHDDLWKIPGITLTPEEFSPVLKIIERMGRNHVLTRKDVAQFLLSLGKVLLPSQGALIAETLKSSSSWESLVQMGRHFHVHLVVASFLTDPERFVHIPTHQLQEFWNDDNGGCVWGVASYSNTDIEAMMKPYPEVLNEIPVRRCVASILTGNLPERVQKQSKHKLPALPKSVVKYILDDMLGASGKGVVDPHRVAWLCFDDTLSLSKFL